MQHLADLFAPGLDSQSFRNRTAHLMRDLLGCQVVSFATLEVATHRLQIDFDPCIPAINPGLPGFAKHMAKYPCFNFDPTVAGGKPFLRGDFLTDEQFYASDIYLESFKLGGLTDHAAVLLPSPPGTVFFLGMERAGGTYQPADRDLLWVLQPHLANATRLADSYASLEEAVADPEVFARAGLSRREAEVLGWLARGKSNADISQILEISLDTVKTHLRRVFDKLGVDNRHAALLRAHELARRSEPPNPGARRMSARVARP
jgi:DNA-binding CsgD family transcriptional regulator